MTSQKVHKHKSEKKRSSSSSSQHKSHKLKSKHGEHHLKRKYLKKLRKGAQSISFPYQLFLYRQELRRSSSDFSYLRLSRAKIMLTSKLIANNINTYNQMSSVDDLKVLSREVQFKKRLCNQVERLEQFKELGLTEMIMNGKKTVL
ncbi:uncharacterized protein Dwil_GK17439 [Drosophila willistoni]|uniref:Uncharacterized protein n=1 Tax=Drosophila willistoni TaxID=7260 RepID=B4MM74_DROWI|nr:uncharacterized protein Dwil_GK17439 [Drosophila willistoni]